jgi:AraC-like DNA-binding protein
VRHPASSGEFVASRSCSSSQRRRSRGVDSLPLLAVVLALRPERIAALLLETAPATTGRPGAAVEATPAGIAVNDASPALIDAIRRLLALLDAPDDAAALATGVEREVLWRLITGPQGATVRQIGLADSRLAHLARAIRWIRGHYNETLRVEQLAAFATMSVSSFHRHFRAVTSMTPIQFQKQIRLREARARLLAQPGDISGVGVAVGYDSPSQFSREYRRCSACHQATTRSHCARPPRLPSIWLPADADVDVRDTERQPRDRHCPFPPDERPNTGPPRAHSGRHRSSAPAPNSRLILAEERACPPATPGSFGRVTALLASRPFTTLKLVARLIFWRLLGDLVLNIWLVRAKSRAKASVYGTEGHRFESCRAR